ncbi:MAG TPA: tetratricopeptide repeat protein [Pirellulales bacterium]|nr:tetratricopeptide repeat protein [Pirellulales bacterium]
MHRALVRFLVVLAALWSPCVRAEPGKPGEVDPAAPADSDRSAAVPPAAVLDFDDTVEPFTPVRTRSEAENDRIEALGLFAAARVDEQEDRTYQALRRYQRATRFDPSSQVARRQAVVLAMRLADGGSSQQEKEGHWQSALRYAATNELGINEAGVLWELARHFAQEEQYPEALRYFRAARALQPEKRSTGYLILSLDVGRMAYLTHEFAAAADAFGEVMEALEHPDQSGLDERFQRSLLAGKDRAAAQTQLYLLFAEGFLSAERFDQATAAFEKLNRISPNPAVLAFRLARVEDARKQPAKALELLQAYFDAKETSEGLAPYLLFVELVRGREANNDNSKPADDVISKVAELHHRDPDNRLVTLFLAEQYRAAERFDQAEPLYTTVLAGNPSSLAYRGLAATQRRLKRTENLLALLGDLAGKTGSLEALGDETKAVSADKDLVESLVRTARDRHRADPDSIGFGQRLATALVALEAARYDDASEFFELAMKVNQESAKDLYRTWGVGLLTKQRYDDAATVLKRAIDERAVTVGDPTLHFLLSGALVMAGKTDEALAAAQHAASLAPRSLQVAFRAAWILYYAKRHEEAAAAYKELIRRFDEEEQSDDARQQLRGARMVLSNIAVIENDTPAAEEWLSQVLDEFPGDIGAQNDLGYLWADQNKHLKMAQGMIERAVAAEPDNVAFRDSLGWILYRVGRYEDAVAELKKAVAAADPDGTVLEHLGDACLAAGQRQAAEEAWQKAQAEFEKDADADKIARIKQKRAALPAQEANKEQ